MGDLVTDALRTAILNKEYPAGMRLRQEEVAETLGVSRQPVREAMKAMVMEGLLVADGRKGHYVRDFTPEYLDENYRLRNLLEGEAASLAAQKITVAQLRRMAELNDSFAQDLSPSSQLRANYDFHKIVRVAASSPTLDQIIDGLWLVLTVATPVTIPGRAGRSAEEHGAIIAALEARNPDAARLAVASHIQNAAQEYFDAINAETT